MRLKSVVKYNISEMKNSVLIFYGIIAAILILTVFSLVKLANNNVDGSVSGAEMASAIFLFVVGLNSFKHNYLFLSTNGITRKTSFNGFLISSLLMVVVMAVIDTVYSNILAEVIVYKPMFSQIYTGWVADVSKPLFILMGFVWSLALYLFAIFLGYSITTLYYRMSKMLKIIVSIGVPAMLFTILPGIDAIFNNGRMYRWFGKIFIILAGNGENPFVAIASMLIGTIILAGLAYLLVRRAPIKG